MEDLQETLALCFLLLWFNLSALFVLADLNWLLVHFHIDFKILLLSFKVSNGLTHNNLSEVFDLYNPKRALRPSQMLFVQPRAKFKA